MFPLNICPELSQKYNFGYDSLLPRTKSKHGYDISIHNGSAWITPVEVFVPGIGITNRYFPLLINDHPLIEYSARKFVQYQLETTSSTKGVEILCRLLRNMTLNPHDSEEKTTESILNWVDDSFQALEPNEESIFSAIRSYINFCVEEEYWAFTEPLLWFTEAATFKRAKSGAAAFHEVMLDPDNGPYSQSQLVVIFQAADSCGLNPTERALLTLCRDLGLRPIQIALLREEDFISDIRGSYLRVPRVKGYKRSALRRKTSNFVERPLSEALASDIRLVIKENEKVFRELGLSLKNDFSSRDHSGVSPARPIFPISKITSRHLQLYSSPSTRDYTYHLANYSISSIIRRITYKLNIVSNSDPQEAKILQIGAYRFRRTKATIMAMQGYTVEEIAYALDHSSISSVKHYINFSKDLIDFVNLSTASSYEITTLKKHWEGKFIKERKSDASEIRLTKIDSLGLCSLNGACEFHPTVSCYGCNKFRPYVDGSHRKAYENIIHTQKMIATDSSGPVSSQLSFAAQMALQCADEAERLSD